MEQHSKSLPLLMVSTSFPKDQQDWRGTFIRHMAIALAQRPDIDLRLWAPPGWVPDEVTRSSTPEELRVLEILMERGGIAHLLRSTPLQGVIAAFHLMKSLNKAYRREQGKVALLHINWLQNILPLWGSRNSAPLLVTVLGSDHKLLRLPGMVAALRQVMRGRRVIIAPNAEWMVSRLTECFGDLCSIVPVSFGIDQSWYETTRLSVSGPHKWLVVLRLTKKKIGNLLSWGESIFSGGEHQLHIFGPMQEHIELPKWVHYHGPTHPQLLNKWFPIASGMITLSQHDEGRPQVILESMASGLPVIASSIPAHCDLLQHQKTGWLVDSCEEFAQAIDRVSKPEINLRIGIGARAWVASEIGTWQQCSQRYVNLYQKLLDIKQ